MPGLTIPVSERDHAQGDADAPITLVEYGDYECPHCGRAHPIVRAVQQRLGSRLRFVFRNFPLSTMHPHAQAAAEAAEAAGAQGKFWEMHHLLFQNQHDLDNAHLREFAAQLTLDTEQFDQELSAHAFAPQVRADFSGGVRSGVNGTPTFFINGVRHNGSWDENALLAALEAAQE